MTVEVHRSLLIEIQLINSVPAFAQGGQKNFRVPVSAQIHLLGMFAIDKRLGLCFNSGCLLDLKDKQKKFRWIRACMQGPWNFFCVLILYIYIISLILLIPFVSPDSRSLTINNVQFMLHLPAMMDRKICHPLHYTRTPSIFPWRNKPLRDR